VPESWSHDVAAALVAVVLTIGIIILAVLELEIPSELGTSETVAITWLFIRSAQAAEQAKLNGS